jgi:hypothetical protein
VRGQILQNEDTIKQDSSDSSGRKEKKKSGEWTYMVESEHWQRIDRLPRVQDLSHDTAAELSVERTEAAIKCSAYQIGGYKLTRFDQLSNATARRISTQKVGPKPGPQFARFVLSELVSFQRMTQRTAKERCECGGAECHAVHALSHRRIEAVFGYHKQVSSTHEK